MVSITERLSSWDPYNHLTFTESQYSCLLAHRVQISYGVTPEPGQDRQSLLGAT